MEAVSPPPGAIAVVFISQRTKANETAYEAAAVAMMDAVSRREGFIGAHSIRDAEGCGVTISYWRDEAAVAAWREDLAHARIREKGRAGWYEHYEVIVGTVDRAYAWRRTSTTD